MEVHGSPPQDLCEPCMKAKQQKDPSRHSMSKAKAFLERVHVDIGGPLPTTFKNNRYFLLFKDDATGMFFVYAMKTKDEILRLLKEFTTWIEKQSGFKVKRFRAGDELGSKAFEAWFQETGIQWEAFSTLYT